MSEPRESIEIHEADEWAAVYVNGKIQRVGDAYLADEWLRDHFGVKTIQDDAFMKGQRHREGVAQTLDEVHAYAAARQEVRDHIAALRAEAKRLEGQADDLARRGVEP